MAAAKKLYLIARKSASTTCGFKFLTSNLTWTGDPTAAYSFVDRSHADAAAGLVKGVLAGAAIKGVRVEIEAAPKITFLA